MSGLSLLCCYGCTLDTAIAQACPNNACISTSSIMFPTIIPTLCYRQSNCHNRVWGCTCTLKQASWKMEMKGEMSETNVVSMNCDKATSYSLEKLKWPELQLKLEQLNAIKHKCWGKDVFVCVHISFRKSVCYELLRLCSNTANAERCWLVLYCQANHIVNYWRTVTCTPLSYILIHYSQDFQILITLYSVCAYAYEWY
jgi:hypothetical protein